MLSLLLSVSELPGGTPGQEGENLPAQSSEALEGGGADQSSAKSRTHRAPPPSYHNLRYEENWSFLSEVDDDDPWRRLKFIPLSGDGNVYISLGGQFRARAESWSNFGFGEGESFDDTFGLMRLRLHSDLRLGANFRLFVEGKSAVSTSRDLPGGIRTLDADSADLQNVFLDLSLPVGDDGSLTFRGGRQELQFGKQRLVSPLDWSNTRPRMFDGFRGVLRLKSWRVDGFWSRFVRLRKYSFNNHDSGTDFYGFYASGKLPNRLLDLDFYWLGVERNPILEQRHTLGSRLAGPIGRTAWDFDVEASYQFGQSGTEDVEAFMVASQIGYTFPTPTLRPRFQVGFDYASGDDNPADGIVRTFDQLFPLGHAYFGYMDFVGRQNIIDFSQGLSFQPARRTRLAVDGHFFWRARAGDALYNAGGSVVREGVPGTPRGVGSELDVTCRYTVNRHTVVVLGFSHFFAGKFIRATGSARDANFGYFTVQYTF